MFAAFAFHFITSTSIGPIITITLHDSRAQSLSSQ